ncbi:hypothetical protein T439DRAFT_323546 [Meredithblackwellia eburnea MCA 4105]
MELAVSTLARPRFGSNASSDSMGSAFQEVLVVGEPIPSAQVLQDFGAFQDRRSDVAAYKRAHAHMFETGVWNQYPPPGTLDTGPEHNTYDTQSQRTSLEEAPSKSYWDTVRSAVHSRELWSADDLSLPPHSFPNFVKTVTSLRRRGAMRASFGDIPYSMLDRKDLLGDSTLGGFQGRRRRAVSSLRSSIDTTSDVTRPATPLETDGLSPDMAKEVALHFEFLSESPVCDDVTPSTPPRSIQRRDASSTTLACEDMRTKF